jgi:dolichol-phosphate mannosyltransferase
MAGFFALGKNTYTRADTLRPLGYKIGLELIVRCNCRHLQEIPIAFLDRTLGKSKMDLHQQWLYLRHLGRLYIAKFLLGTQAISSHT